MKMKNSLLTITFVLLQILLFAQQGRVVKGTIKDSETSEPLPGVSVLVAGTTVATTTDIDGNYSITVDGEGKKLVFSYVGYTNQTVSADKDVIDITLAPSATMLNETVVTALGVSREKKTLGYATQQISGDQLTTVKSSNFVNQISGKVSGVRVKSSGNMGGSTNIIVRGATSVTGNNQALFIVDGVPMNNDVTNTDNQARGANGYDYGNPISDINPEDIESMNVLKGAAATALYGSRAARGVVIITTKKGKASADTRKRFGVTLNSNLTIGMVDKSTFPTYQQENGGGYGPYYGPGTSQTSDSLFFKKIDINGDGIKDDVVPYTEDASMGAQFDPNLMVYQWDAFVPSHKNYKKATPWVAAGDNGPISFFRKSMSVTNGFAIDGGSDKGTFRVSYTNGNESGVMPNSTLKKNSFGFNGGTVVNDNLSASASVNYTNTNAVGRNETGYNDNIMSSFRQWMQTNVNYQDQKAIYEETKQNYSWNPRSTTSPLTPIYWDNPYFQRNESYQSDVRDRIYGNITINYKINDFISLLSRFALDQYSTLQEERVAFGSVSRGFGINNVTSTSGYSRLDKRFRESNLDFMANFKKDFNENLSFTGLVGSNIRRSNDNRIFSSTNGGLAVPGTYAIANSKSSPLAPIENELNLGVDGYFANASLGYKRFIFLDVSARNDYSSTLPKGSNSFFYPSASASFIFSEKLKSLSWLDFGKLRLNVANVGNDAPFASVKDGYAILPVLGSQGMLSVTHVKNNPNLKPEISSTKELGLEMVFFKKRLGFDFATYTTNTKNQIFNVSVSPSTGYSSKFVNAGKIQNKGFELNVYGTPFKTKNFDWTVNVNFSRNINKVIKLFEDEFGNKVTNIQIANFPGGVTLNATEGEALGSLKGSDFIYHPSNGQKVVDANGNYKKTTATDITLGNINPKFIAGITNTFTYKNFSYSFLIDMQQGGSIWSVDMWYGMGTGLYPETASKNAKGHSIRDKVWQGGGVVLEGVKEDGTKNDIYTDAYTAFGYNHDPNAGYIYDASYVKLREMSLSYKIPFKKDGFFTNANVGLVGSNLWIIHKNIPYSDPEAGSGAGNVQGVQVGVMPTVRTFGFNLTLQF